MSATTIISQEIDGYQWSDDDDGFVHQHPPSNTYDEHNPTHKRAEKIRASIKNFLLVDAKENLSLLRELTNDDIFVDMSSLCSCGCYMPFSIFSSFRNADIESLRFIVENQLVSVDMIMYILFEYLCSSGTLVYSDRKKYESEVKNESENKMNLDGDFDVETDSMIEYLFGYVIRTHPEIMKTWKHKNHEHIGKTIFHSAFYGFDNDNRLRRVEQLLEIGCDPFAEDEDGLTPFYYMIENLYYDLIERIVSSSSSNKLIITECINRPAYIDRMNVFMSVLSRYCYLKDVDELNNLKKTIGLILANGVDLNHIDRHGRNISDYIVENGFSKFLENVMYTDIFPAPTKNFEPQSKFDVERLAAMLSHPSPFIPCFYRHRFAKTEAELKHFNDEYQNLVSRHGPLTEEKMQEKCTGDFSFLSLKCIMRDWDYYFLLNDE